MHASQNSHKEIVETLLERGANISQKASDKGWTALLFACFKGCEETTGILLDHRCASPNERDNDGRTPLIAACFEGHKEVVKLLLVRGANICDKNDDGESALIYAYSQVNDIHNMFNRQFYDAQDHLYLKKLDSNHIHYSAKREGLNCSLLSTASFRDLFEFIGNEGDYIDYPIESGRLYIYYMYFSHFFFFFPLAQPKTTKIRVLINGGDFVEISITSFSYICIDFSELNLQNMISHASATLLI